MKILKTTDYSKFTPDVHNRDVLKIKKVLESLKLYGWLEAYPMHVVSEGGKLVIKDGQHRFEAAKQLKIPALYVVCENADVVIADINNAQTAWGFKDYLSTYCKQGKSDYIKIKDFSIKTGIGIGQIISMFSGEVSTNGNYNDKFKRGTFKIKDTKLAETVGDLALFLSGFVKFGKDSKLIAVLSKCCRIPQFDIKTFKARVESAPQMLRRCATGEDYAVLIESIYNFRARSPIPLKFLIDQEMRKSTFFIQPKTN